MVEFASDLSAAEFNQLAALLELWGLERVKNKQREKWRLVIQCYWYYICSCFIDPCVL